ncbi:P2X purinoceptor 7-like [Protopterus annectens]|uniref:P2X purinoceptor 7-like n=1 Tax=Protopterus annectens TaxID=7888 RepID=UPI001CFC30FA|nr:P2X purinoceptor 7-like [Protopterus annectens]
METKYTSENAPAVRQADGLQSQRKRMHPNSGNNTNKKQGNMRERSLREQQANIMTHEGQQDFQSIQNKIQELSTEEMRHLCNLMAERNPSLVQEILEEQQRQNSEITEQHQAELPHTWCVCHSCRDMPTTQERVCCANSPTNCLSLVPEMSEVVLHQGVLRVADTYRRAIFGIPLETDENRRFRHSAYRQFTVWRYGRLGSRVHQVIPSCCVWRIRNKYPNPLGQYTGFLPQRRTVLE